MLAVCSKPQVASLQSTERPRLNPVRSRSVTRSTPLKSNPVADSMEKL